MKKYGTSQFFVDHNHVCQVFKDILDLLVPSAASMQRRVVSANTTFIPVHKAAYDMCRHCGCFGPVGVGAQYSAITFNVFSCKPNPISLQKCGIFLPGARHA